MELRQHLLTDESRELAAGMLAHARFSQELPAYLWPQYDTDRGFAEWNRCRREVLDEHARPIWDETLALLARRDGYALADAGLLRLVRFLERVVETTAPMDSALAVLEYTAEALKIEDQRAGAETVVGPWLDGEDTAHSRPWWKWRLEDDGYGLYIPDLFPIVGIGRPSRTVHPDDTWSSVREEVEDELTEARDALRPHEVLRGALRFQTAVVEDAVLYYAATGSSPPPYLTAFEDRRDVVPFPIDLPGALTVPYEVKVRFVRVAQVDIEDSGRDRTKDEMLRAIADRLQCRRDTAREVAVSIGAYRPQEGRGRPTLAQEELDRVQFMDAVDTYFELLDGGGGAAAEA